jgi:fluoroquinolone resistance protein
VAQRGSQLPPPTELSVTREDWYGDDLSGRDWSRVAFADVDMTETSSTSGTRFTECTFRGVRFNVSTHAGAAFDNCSFTDCNFFGATLTDCKLLGSRFNRCSFERLTVKGGDWSFVGLAGAKLGTASFEDVRMREADLTGARWDGSVLRRVDLSGAWLAQANFDRCDLRGSDISALDPWSSSLQATIITWDQAMMLASAMGLDVRPDEGSA